jgi:hypothetical protein
MRNGRTSSAYHSSHLHPGYPRVYRRGSMPYRTMYLAKVIISMPVVIRRIISSVTRLTSSGPIRHVRAGNGSPAEKWPLSGLNGKLWFSSLITGVRTRAALTRQHLSRSVALERANDVLQDSIPVAFEDYRDGSDVDVEDLPITPTLFQFKVWSCKVLRRLMNGRLSENKQGTRTQGFKLALGMLGVWSLVLLLQRFLA